MTTQQCRDQIQKILDRACPELKMEVCGNYTQMNIQYCMGYIGYSFCIDTTEWEKAKWPEHIVRIRLLVALQDLRDLVDGAIKEIE